jgi:hypothetical protein
MIVHVISVSGGKAAYGLCEQWQALIEQQERDATYA